MSKSALNMAKQKTCPNNFRPPQNSIMFISWYSKSYFSHLNKIKKIGEIVKIRTPFILSLITILLISISISGCIDNESSDDEDELKSKSVDFRTDMKEFVRSISDYAKSQNQEFIIIPQNGHELLTDDGEPTGMPAADYISAIDGIGREDLFYGYENDNVPTPQADRDDMLSFMDIAKSNGIQVLVTDYCYTQDLIDDSYSQNNAKGYISFAADHRELDNIPPYPSNPYNVNSNNVSSLKNATNFLYLLDPNGFENKNEFLDAIRKTDYDVIIIDLYFNEFALSSSDIQSLKMKTNGGKRLVIAYMSIGEAENYRYYWRSGWNNNNPSWLMKENPDWEGNYKVQYWDNEWQNIITGNNDSYVQNIINAEFDGVYLDIIDAYEYFEDI